jgi:CheY-like chemotaxis protein
MLYDYDFDVRQASCPDQAYRILKEESCDVIVCDLHMPFTFNEHMGEYRFSTEVGARTIQELGWVFPEIPIIGMSAAVPCDITKIRAALGDLPFLEKPFTAAVLLQTINQACNADFDTNMH